MKNLIALILLAGAAYMGYTKYYAVEKEHTVDSLYEQLSSGEVLAAEASVAFKNAAKVVCQVNGADPQNGFGTKEQCLGALNESVHAKCSGRIDGFAGRTYDSKEKLKEDFGVYLKCAMRGLKRD